MSLLGSIVIDLCFVLDITQVKNTIMSHDKRNTVIYYCGFPTARFISHTVNNPCRVFLKCDQINEELKCSFWEWEDAKLNDVSSFKCQCMVEVENKLVDMQNKVVEVQDMMVQIKKEWCAKNLRRNKEVRVVFVLLFAIWVTVLLR